MAKVKGALGASAAVAGGVYAAARYLLKQAIGRRESADERALASMVSTGEVAERIAAHRAAEMEHARELLAGRAPEQVSIVSADGLRLKADLFEPPSGCHGYAIVVHGYTGRRSDMGAFAARYLERGYGVLAPDLRAHGESEGAFIGMGWPDRLDILRWAELIAQRDGEARVVLHGVSMGAATVMMAAGEALPSCVRAVVEDCGYTSVWEIFAGEIKARYHLPAFPLLYLADLMARRQAGYGFREASALNQVSHAQAPILFIHGSADDFVPFEMVHPLYAACPTAKDLYVAEGARHGQAFNLDPDAYFERVFAFVEPHLA